MPFAKWNLEPVFVNRSIRWTGSLKPSPPVSIFLNNKQPTHDQLPNGTELHQTTKNENKSSLDSATSLLPPTLAFTPILTRKKLSNNKQPNIKSKCKYKAEENKSDGSVISVVSNKSNPKKSDENNEEEQWNENDPDKLADNHNEADEDGKEREHSTDSKMQNIGIKSTVDVNNAAQIETQSNVQQPQEVVIEQILLKINNRTLVGIIRQMASLLSISDQMFMEIGEECRRLFERSQQIQSRFVKLSTGIDHLNHQMRHSSKSCLVFFQMAQKIKLGKSQLNR